MTGVQMQQSELFGFEPQLPNGLVYCADFLSADEDQALMEFIGTLPFREAVFKQYTARRRVVRFGAREAVQQETPEHSIAASVEFPPIICRLRDKVASWLDIASTDFVHGLITEYRAGSPIGWHRDAPHFDTVVGISLGSACRMRFRESAARHAKPLSIELQPRSVYVMAGSIRWHWQHSIAPTPATRYSVTLRTLLREGKEQST